MQNEAVKYTASSKSMLFNYSRGMPDPGLSIFALVHAGPQSLLDFQFTVADRIL